ncbi:hypothetical protein [Marivirga sp.]|uniref:hypothetical protein n=1 Tax=Marivirga sp. TaxID=2018662 RepID=UPI003DA7A227
MGNLELKIPYTLWPFKPNWLKKKSEGIKTKKIHYPERWDELTPKQFLRIHQILYMIKGEHIQRAMITMYLSKTSLLLWLRMHLIQRVQLQWLFDWIASEKSVITRNFFPKIRVKGKTLLGPSDAMGNVNAAEFSEADYHFLNYYKSKKEEDLDLLIACLYRKKDPNKSIDAPDYDGDLREAFNTHSVEKRAKTIAKLNKWKKMAIYTFYRGCRKEIEDTYDRVFTKKTAQSVENYGWPETFMRMTGDRFGKIKEVMENDMHEIFLSMQIDLKDQEDWERKNKKK